MDWIEILKHISIAINTSVEENMIYYDKNTITDNWLGFESTDDSDIEKKEKELGITLPKSYKDFLRITNGFRQISLFAGNLLPINKVNWIRKSEPDFIDTLTKNSDTDISDKEYYKYGEEQNHLSFKIKHLSNSLQISNWTDGSIILLNPLVKFGDEWEAWIYSSWNTDVYRYQSFSDLILNEYKSMKDIIKKES